MNKLKQQKLFEYWLEASTDDLASAKEIVTKTQSYVQGLFFLHLSLEKILKAAYVYKHDDHAPLSHNLLNLFSKSALENLQPQFEEVLVEINQFNIEMRYPEDLKNLKAKVTREYSEKTLREGEQVYQWILAKLK